MQKKVLIADDDENILDAMQLILEDAGYEVSVTADGEMVQSMRENLPDLLLLDIWMSGADGAEICRYLKQQMHTKHIPIILCSANKETPQLVKDCGADDFLAKPFDMDDLLRKVAKYLGQPDE